MNKDFRNLFYIFVPAALSGAYALFCIFVPTIPDKKSMENVYSFLQAIGGLAAAITLGVVIWSSRQQSKQWREQMNAEEGRWSLQFTNMHAENKRQRQRRNEDNEKWRKSRLEQTKIEAVSNILKLSAEFYELSNIIHTKTRNARANPTSPNSQRLASTNLVNDLDNLKKLLVKYSIFTNTLHLLYAMNSKIERITNNIGQIVANSIDELESAMTSNNHKNTNFNTTDSSGYFLRLSSAGNELRQAVIDDLFG